jgi:hypothetical protein
LSHYAKSIVIKVLKKETTNSVSNLVNIKKLVDISLVPQSIYKYENGSELVDNNLEDQEEHFDEEQEDETEETAAARMTQSTLELAQLTPITSPIMTQFTLQLDQPTTQSSEDVNVEDLKRAAKPASANMGVAQSAFAPRQEWQIQFRPNYNCQRR